MEKKRAELNPNVLKHDMETKRAELNPNVLKHDMEKKRSEMKQQLEGSVLMRWRFHVRNGSNAMPVLRSFTQALLLPESDRTAKVERICADAQMRIRHIMNPEP
ncbi:hypothetical protein T484DRAFT_1819587 [Baffinella frigidus]|nr:hypothetical protein T484DRAFT_1819587 [Cryptophyta sp. CCMP2293]